MTHRPLKTLYRQSMNGTIETFQCSPRNYSFRNYYRVKIQTPPIPIRLQGPGILYRPLKGSGSACYQDYYANTTVSIARVYHSEYLLIDYRIWFANIYLTGLMMWNESIATSLKRN